MSVEADTSTTGKHLPALDGLRGSAVLLVMMCHLWGGSDPRTPINLFTRITVAGWVGVDLFFALSGFLLTGILYDTLSSGRYFRNFYARRALRIFPLYYVVLLSLIAVIAALGYRWTWRIWLYLTFTETLVFPGGMVASAGWLEFPFWSLAVEEHFYLFWPVLMFALRTKRRIAGAACILAMFSAAFRTILLLHGDVAIHPGAAYFLTPGRIDTLLIGSLLALLIRSSWRTTVLRVAPATAVAGMFVILGYVLWRGSNFIGDPFVVTIGFTVLGVTFTALIAWSLLSKSLAERVFRLGLLQSVGRLSYGMYLFHLLVGNAFDRYTSVLLVGIVHSHFIAHVANGLLLTVITALFASLSYRFFEEPVLALKRHFQDGGDTPKLSRALLQASQLEPKQQ